MPSSVLISQSIIEPLGAFVAAHGGHEAGAAIRAVKSRSGPHGEPQVAVNKVIHLLEDLAHRLHNPALGVAYAREFPIGGTGALGFVLTQSATLRDAVEAVGRYTRIVMPQLHIHYEATHSGAELTWSYPLLVASPMVQFNSFVAALVVVRLRSILSKDWSPARVHLAHRDPGALAAYRDVFGPNLKFDQHVNAISFRNVNLDRRNADANPRLLAVVKQLADILLAERRERPDFQSVVANTIVDMLGQAPPSLAAVASQLAIGERTVQRRLSTEGTSFEDVLGETRRTVAERLLCDTDLPITDIAFLLGFSEVSAFTRAAKRWHGMPPRQFRMTRGKAG
jgi:AraC-like DNA-binding protein